MFEVNQYKIVFKRIWHSQKLNDGRYDTRCEFWIKDVEVPRYVGLARLHPNDVPHKIVGKKVALQNTIKQARVSSHRLSGCTFYDKKTRTDIWCAFWKWIDSWDENKNKQIHRNMIRVGKK